MDRGFWLQRWQQGQIGFHRQSPHPALERYHSHWQAAAGETVFVPLCGKSQDLRWLAGQGHEVIGVELSELATRAFFEEQGLSFQETSTAPFLLRESRHIHLYTGDYFALEPGTLAGCRLIYDRAAMIALPPEMRREYVRQLFRLFPGSLRLLLVTMEYPQAQMQGPPFAVLEDEVRARFEPRCRVTHLERRDILVQEPQFRDQGLTELSESVYLIRA